MRNGASAMDIEFLKGLGYMGLFLLALISNAIPYSTIPYLAFVAPILSRLTGTTLVGAILALAIGATVGKLVVYTVGRSISRIRTVSRSMSELIEFAGKYRKAMFIVTFIVAALPIPDDVFYIPIGASRYNLALFTIALFAGKVVVTVLAAFYGLLLRGLIEEYAGASPFVAVPIMIVVTALLMIVLGKIRWKEIERTYLDKGLRATLILVARSLAEMLLTRPLSKLKSLFCGKTYGDEEEPGR